MQTTIQAKLLPDKEHQVFSLADCKYNPSINGIKILLGLISLSIKKPNNTGFKIFKFSTTELANFLGVSYQNRCCDVRKVIEQLKKAKVILPDPGTKSINERPIVPWISYSKISESKNVVDLKLNEELEQYLMTFHLEPNYLTYQLAIIMQMKSAHSIKIYHILLKHFWKKDGKIIKNDFETTVDDLKERLIIPKEMYPLAGNFKIKVLDIAQKECEMYSDITFTFEPLKYNKVGKQIYGYKFKISPNPNYKPISIELESIST